MNAQAVIGQDNMVGSLFEPFRMPGLDETVPEMFKLLFGKGEQGADAGGIPSPDFKPINAV